MTKTDSKIMQKLATKHLGDSLTRIQVEQTAARITIRQDLVALRKIRGLTQRQLAKRMGVTQPVVAELESTAPRNIELRTLVRAAAALGATLRITLEDAASAPPVQSRRSRKAAA